MQAEEFYAILVKHRVLRDEPFVTLSAQQINALDSAVYDVAESISISIAEHRDDLAELQRRVLRDAAEIRSLRQQLHAMQHSQARCEAQLVIPFAEQAFSSVNPERADEKRKEAQPPADQ